MKKKSPHEKVLNMVKEKMKDKKGVRPTNKSGAKNNDSQNYK